MPAVRRLLAVICALAMLTGCAPGALPIETPTSTTDTTKADAVMRIVRDTMAQAHLKAVIVRATVDGKEVVTQAVGESMTGVPATPAMHFRNGAVAISYVSTLLLKLVDEKKVSLDDKLSKWLPEIPHADRVTLGQLAQMTSGYVDYVIGNTAMNDALYANPFRPLDRSRHPELRHRPAAALPARQQLELRPHQLRAARPGAGEGHRPGDVEAIIGQGASAPRSDKHGQLTDPRDPVAGPARLQL
jgi:CubicO group peptidase (beta-lactamase class C family)